LDSDSLNQYDESFSVLNWWQHQKRIYPNLSILAKDIMTLHVSTISSESAFSLSGMLLDDWRRSLTSAHVERLSLIKDWELANARQQHNMENKELEEMIENLFLDDGPTTDAAGSTVCARHGSWLLLSSILVLELDLDCWFYSGARARLLVLVLAAWFWTSNSGAGCLVLDISFCSIIVFYNELLF
jgi:hypothetical protein